MKVRSFLFFSALFTFYLVFSFAQGSLLSSKDIQETMNQLFEYHIDKKEMSTLILERSLKVYLKNFDPSHIYLLKTEAAHFTHPTAKNLNRMLLEYKKHQFSSYFALNKKIEDSIQRARVWRLKWQQNPQKLVEDAKKIHFDRHKESSFCSQLTDLQERHYKKFIELIAFHLKESDPSHKDKETQYVTLCEKQLVAMENEFLGIKDQNQEVSHKERDHFIYTRILKSLANSLDAHTSYYSPDEAYAMKVQLEKGMCGIGVVLKEGIEGVTIQDLINGGPAEQSGKIKKGDTIVEVDGEQVKKFSFHRVLEIMKGKEGTKTILGIMRYENLKPDFLRVELTRSKITLPDQRVDVIAEPYGDGIIGKVTLHSFYEGENDISSEKDLKQAIEQLKQSGPLYGLVLDMRDNTGGFLSQSIKVAGLFISSGVVVISKYSDDSMKYYRSMNGAAFYEGPLVVLISKGSASATEIVAQAIKDYGVGVIVGDEQTYGKGTIQHQTITSDGPPAFFKVTIGRYYTVSGKSTQIDGVKTDIVVPSPFNFEEVGEAYLEYPLPADVVESVYQDSLSDIDPLARKWFQKYYLPNLQKKESYWQNLIPSLRENSAKRLEQNKNFQLFLTNIKKTLEPIEVISFGVNDLQMEEAVNILKDMILMSQEISIQL